MNRNRRRELIRLKQAGLIRPPKVRKEQETQTTEKEDSHAKG